MVIKVNKKKNKRKLKIKNILITLVILIILIIISIFGYKYYKYEEYKKTDEYKLITLGYKQDEIDILNKYLKKDQINKILDMKYSKDIIDYIMIKDFIFDNLDRYLNYKVDESKENKIFLVNNDIDKLDINYSPIILDLLKQKYYKKENLERYIKYNSNNVNIDSEEIIRRVNSNLDYDYYTNIKDTDMSKGNLIIVNKYYKLNNDYVPSDLTMIDSNGNMATKDTVNAYNKMIESAAKENLKFKINSAYRSYSTQEYLYNRYKSNHGFAWAERYSARPGYSEHQTGLALDIVSNSSNFNNFEDTKEYSWLQDNAYKYGFIMRYLDDKQYITGYSYESWHYRYVGVEAAKKIKDENLTFEEYYEYYVNKK